MRREARSGRRAVGIGRWLRTGSAWRGRLPWRLTAAGVLAASVLAGWPADGLAQRGRGGPGAALVGGQSAALFDLTGYWVSLITDDWRYRMVTPPRGNVDFLPVNAEGRRVTASWDPAQDEAAGEQCRGYGAVGVMRLPGRLHLTWEDDSTLRIDTDTGTQTRRLRFGAAVPEAAPTWQGSSVAQWELPGGRGRGPSPDEAPGQLKAVTTRMRPGYLRKNGVPYGANATLTEYFVPLKDDDGAQYLAVTAFLEDPQYLAQPYIRTAQFKKLSDATGWNPTPCSAR